jgi:alkylation response protein AidB-like acyl-CoA dehydrogenase
MADQSYLQWPFLAEEHRTLARDLRKWCGGHIKADHPHDVDAACRALARSLGQSGWLKAATGSGKKPSVRSLCISRESLAYHSGLADFVFAMQGLGSVPISLFGSDALKKKWLNKVGEGSAISAFAISEPDAGSDIAAMKTTARRDADAFIIDGTKTWISNAGIADFYVTFCRFPEAGEKGYIALLVESNTPGLHVSERINVIAPHPLGTLEYKNCRVPAANLIGQAGAGLKIALASLDLLRSTVAAAALGFARRALDEAVSFATQRQAFGKSLSDFQMTQAKLADMALAIDASALLVYRAAWAYDTGAERVTREAAMAKLHATESAQRVIDEAVQILGGRGVVSGAVVEQLYREIRALRIYEGTSEIQKLVIASQVLKQNA